MKATFTADHATWEARKRGLLSKIEKLAKGGQPTDVERAELRELQLAEPKAPRVPGLLHQDATTEALTWAMYSGWPSAAIASAEGGTIFGSHAMGPEFRTRNLAFLNTVWDGGTFTVERRTKESYSVYGRLTFAVQVQEQVFREFCDDGGLSQGIGFVPGRCLLAYPESTQGTRTYREPPVQWPGLSRFNARIAEILRTPVRFDDSGRLAPKMLKLSPDAKAGWIAFSNQVELQLGADGQFCDVRGAAAKTAENAARIACLFHVLQHGTDGEVGIEDFNSAKAIAAWHLSESLRFFGVAMMPPELAAAARLEAWLIDYCHRNHVGDVPAAAVQKAGPRGLRAKTEVEAAVGELAVLGRARVVKRGHARSIEANPALLDASKTARTAKTSTAKLKDEKETMTHYINQEEVEI